MDCIAVLAQSEGDTDMIDQHVHSTEQGQGDDDKPRAHSRGGGDGDKPRGPSRGEGDGVKPCVSSTGLLQSDAMIVDEPELSCERASSSIQHDPCTGKLSHANNEEKAQHGNAVLMFVTEGYSIFKCGW